VPVVSALGRRVFSKPLQHNNLFQRGPANFPKPLLPNDLGQYVVFWDWLYCWGVSIVDVCYTGISLYPIWRIEMRDKDKEAKERMKAWRALPVEGRISWQGFKRQWAMMSDEQRKGSK